MDVSGVVRIDLAGTLHVDVDGSLQMTVLGDLRMTLPVTLRLPASWQTTLVDPRAVRMPLHGRLSLRIPGSLVVSGENVKMNVPGVLQTTLEVTLDIDLPMTSRFDSRRLGRW